MGILRTIWAHWRQACHIGVVPCRIHSVDFWNQQLRAVCSLHTIEAGLPGRVQIRAVLCRKRIFCVSNR